MASEKLGTLPPQHVQNGLSSHPHPQLVYPEFACGPQSAHSRSAVAGDPGPKSATRELTASFLDHHHFFQNHHPAPPPRQTAEFRHHWTNSRSSATNSGSDDHDSDDEDDEEDDDNDDEDNNNHGSMVTLAKINHTDSVGTSNNDQKMKQLAVLGMKEGNLIQIGNGCSNDNNSSEAKNIGEVYYTQYLQGGEGLSSSSGQKDNTVENGCEDGRRKESFYSSESNEPLRTILSDPLTGALMDNAMILPCGHSFGSGGIQQIIRMKACCTCSQSVSEDSIAPNLSLRLAVQAFRREQQLQVNRASKKRKERYDHEKGTCGDLTFTDHQRGRGVQFPFSVRDRVIIKGNKRTPPRFVGREAIVTTQCLNGWYVVKTLDNAESVKLQYRSLAKVGDDGSSNSAPVKMTPNWL